MASSISQLGDILKDIYMGGPPQPIVKPVEWWSCRKHKYPNTAHYEERCIFDADCDDYECPHRDSFKVRDGCPECATAEWVQCVYGDTGDPAYEAVFRSGIAWQLEHESTFLKLLLQEDIKRKRYGS